VDVNPDKLNASMGKMLVDVGAAMNASQMLRIRSSPGLAPP
jgi:hypothetical protein